MLTKGNGSPGTSLYDWFHKYSNIPKSETLLGPSILDKGFSTVFTNSEFMRTSRNLTIANLGVQLYKMLVNVYDVASRR